MRSDTTSSFRVRFMNFMRRHNCSINEDEQLDHSKATILILLAVFYAKYLGHILYLKSAPFWDLICCSQVVRWCFGGTYCLHLQGRKVNQAGNQISYLCNRNRYHYMLQGAPKRSKVCNLNDVTIGLWFATSGPQCVYVIIRHLHGDLRRLEVISVSHLRCDAV
jgi:hypothetical protein